MAYLAGDQQDTESAAIDSASLNVTRRYYDPYGNPRGPVPSTFPAGEKGFVGGATDTATGLTDLGAREYQPGTGTFISPDPELKPYEPQDLNPYAYAEGNPSTYADPTGAGITRTSGSYAGDTPTCNDSADVQQCEAQEATQNQPRNAVPTPIDSTSNSSGCQLWSPACAPHHTHHKHHHHRSAPVRKNHNHGGGGGGGGVLGVITSVGSAVGSAASSAFGTAWSTTVTGMQNLNNFVAQTACLATPGGTLNPAICLNAPGMVATCGGSSFTAGTEVLLASGAAIPIDKLKAGDKVLATNTKTGKTQAETVAAVLVHHDTNLYNLRIKAGNHTAVIHTTRNHLFWDVTSHHWIQAAALHPGDRLRTPTNTAATVIGGSPPAQTTGWMWDLTIPGDHDFYIDTTAAATLVHNCDDPLAAKLDNISGHVKLSDLTAAQRELNGEVVARKGDGTPFDHVKEVQDAQAGLINMIERAQRMLNNSSLGDDQRSIIEADLSRASRLLDYTEKYVPRH